MACYCGDSRSFEECCKPFLDGTAHPDTAEQLMRSRYSAYAVQDIDYVIATHDPATSDEVDRESSEQWARTSTWNGLEIVDTVAGGSDDDTGEVEFIAHYNTGEGHPVAHRERSVFKRIDGRWYYMDGTIVRPKPVVRDKPKVGRNEPCPCGSGKKYKKCCGR